MNLAPKSRLPLLIGLALLLLTLVLYWPVLNCDFVNYDDDKYVTENPQVQGGLTLQSLRWAFTTGYASNWHPLTWLSHMADCQLFGLRPRGHHLTNLLLHLANTLLLFGVLRRMTGALWPSAMVAALFAWHPAHVESVAWVAERKDLLSTFFFLLTLGAYARYAAQSKVQSPKSKVSYAMALLLFALGLMSKPMLVTVPFVLLLLDYWPLGRSAKCGVRNAELGKSEAGSAPARRWAWLVAEKAPFFALSAVSCVITIIAQRRGGSVVPMEVISLDARCWNALVSYLRYVGKLFWPSDLAVIYPYVYPWPVWLIGAAAVLLLAVSWLAFRLRRQAPYFPVGWFWFLGTLVPVIGLVQVGEQAMADRYSYIPSIGLFMVICWAVPQLLGGWPLRRPALLFTAAVALSVCAVLTRAQLSCWRDVISLFEHAVAVTKDNATAHNSLGTALAARNRLDEAIAHYNTALQLNPSYGLAHNNLGVALARLGRYDEAVAQYQAALEINPQDVKAHFNLANAFSPVFQEEDGAAATAPSRRSDVRQSREQYLSALAVDPGYVPARINLGNLEASEGNLDAAIRCYQDALQTDPLAALAHFNLAIALARTGKTNEALSSFARAVELQPDHPDAQFRLANLLASQGQFEKAISHYHAVLKLKPNDFGASCNLGGALAKLGRLPEASRCFAEAIRLRPDYPDAHAHLGKLLALQRDLAGAVREYSEALRLEPDNPEFHHQAALWLAQQGKMNEAVSHFATVAKLKSKDPGAQYDLALALVKLGRGDRAVEHFREALRLSPDRIQAMNNLAWILATHEKEQVRNGAEAVKLATRACVLTDYQDAQVVGTLAAAYAEAGRFAEAVEAAQKTCELALAAGKPELADRARARLKLYQAGKPYHEDSRSVSQ